MPDFVEAGASPHYICSMATLAVSGMTCMKCVARVETALKGFDASATVTLKPPRAVVSDAVPVAALNAALGGKYVLSEERADPLAWARTYYPLFLVLGLIALASFAGGSWMMNFMAGFFIVFGAFKLLDVPAFAAAYQRYDIVAKAVPQWGYVYPFVELGLGFAFLFYWQMELMSWITLVLSLVGAVGVIRSVLAKQTIQCACLGTVFKLPMSTVTIIENLGMAAMAAWMIVAM
jgi:copper chaperone CopZ